MRTFRDATKRHARLLAQARAAQERVVAQRAAERQSIEGQLAERQRLLASIKDQIVRMEAAERARQAEIARAARARLAAAQAAQAAAADPNPSVATAAAVIAPAATPSPDEAAVAAVAAAPPPSTHGGVVGIAMQYLGVAVCLGRRSPSGFDCSGLVSYVFAQMGVSLPHSSYAQYGMGSAVSRGPAPAR